MKLTPKLALKLTLATVFLATSLTGAFATEFTKGVIKKIDMKTKRVTIIHEELANLEMPAMTMVFRTVDDAMLEQLEEGREIEFLADRIKGKLTVIEVK